MVRRFLALAIPGVVLLEDAVAKQLGLKLVP
jgi:hypothetical protein